MRGRKPSVDFQRLVGQSSIPAVRNIRELSSTTLDKITTLGHQDGAPAEERRPAADRAVRVVERLNRIIHACEAGEALDAGDSAWLADRFAKYLDHAGNGMTLDDAVGLTTPPGGEPWWVTFRRRQRDALICRLAREHGPGGSLSNQAAWLLSEGRRYETSAWRSDRHEAAAPATYEGKPKGLLFEICQCGGMPGERQLRTILRKDLGGSNVGNELPPFDCQARRRP